MLLESSSSMAGKRWYGVVEPIVLKFEELHLAPLRVCTRGCSSVFFCRDRIDRLTETLPANLLWYISTYYFLILFAQSSRCYGPHGLTICSWQHGTAGQLDHTSRDHRSQMMHSFKACDITAVETCLWDPPNPSKSTKTGYILAVVCIMYLREWINSIVMYSTK